MADPQLTIRIGADLKPLEQSLGRMDKVLGQLKTGLVQGLGVGAGLGVVNLTERAISGLVGTLGDCVRESMEAAAVQSKLNAVLKSTEGVAGVTAKAANDLASALSKMSGVDDEAILSAESLMMTFTKVGKEVFPEAIESALNMSRAFDQDLKSSVMQLGKALQDPIAGISALRRVGVMLTDSQKDLIESLVKSGDVMGAQRVILRELQTEVGGTARTYGESLPGKIDRFNVSVGNLKQAIGDLTVGPLTDVVEWAERGVEGWNTFFDNWRTWRQEAEQADKAISGRFGMTQLRALDAAGPRAAGELTPTTKAMLETSGLSAVEAGMLGLEAGQAYMDGWNFSVEANAPETWEGIVKGIRIAASRDPDSLGQIIQEQIDLSHGIFGMRPPLYMMKLATPVATGNPLIVITRALEDFSKVPVAANVTNLDQFGRSMNKLPAVLQTTSPVVDSAVSSIRFLNSELLSVSRMMPDTVLTMRAMAAANRQMLADAVHFEKQRTPFGAQYGGAGMGYADYSGMTPWSSPRGGLKDATDDFKSALADVRRFADAAFTTPSDASRFALVGTAQQMGESWDENARRVLDVGNLGAASPFYQQFAGQFAGIEGNEAARKARADQIAADIRESPTLAEIGPGGYATLLANAKKVIGDELGAEELKQKLTEDILKDPAAVAQMKALGINVEDAIKGTAERQIDAVKSGSQAIVDAINGLKPGGKSDEGATSTTEGRTYIPGVGYVDNKKKSYIPGVGYMASGGVVGRDPVMAMLHPQEVVLNTGQQSLVRAVMAAVAAGRDKGGNVFNVEQMEVRADDPRAFMEAVEEMINA